MADLKSCPFCGRRPEINNKGYFESGPWQIICEGYRPVHRIEFWGYKTKSGALRAWNRRLGTKTICDKLTKAIEGLKDCAEDGSYPAKITLAEIEKTMNKRD